MCIYIFSENTNIRIKYLSEIITYKFLGRPQVNIDLLIENPTNIVISKFYLLYPNNFLRHVIKKKKGGI
jgi:hypothetical protein